MLIRKTLFLNPELNLHQQLKLFLKAPYVMSWIKKGSAKLNCISENTNQDQYFTWSIKLITIKHEFKLDNKCENIKLSNYLMVPTHQMWEFVA